MIIKAKAGDEIEYCVVKQELGPGSYSFEPSTVSPKVDIDVTVPDNAIYIRHNMEVLRNRTLKEHKNG